jgi:hypothetical protein
VKKFFQKQAPKTLAFALGKSSREEIFFEKVFGRLGDFRFCLFDLCGG